jgi:hypothetical protein
MTTTINIDKLLPSFGSEILDALYSECQISEGTLDDFLKLPVNENYKPSEENKLFEAKTEEIIPELNLGIKPDLLSDGDLQFAIDDDDLYNKPNMPSSK